MITLHDDHRGTVHVAMFCFICIVCIVYCGEGFYEVNIKMWFEM